MKKLVGLVLTVATLVVLAPVTASAGPMPPTSRKGFIGSVQINGGGNQLGSGASNQGGAKKGAPPVQRGRKPTH